LFFAKFNANVRESTRKHFSRRLRLVARCIIYFANSSIRELIRELFASSCPLRNPLCTPSASWRIDILADSREILGTLKAYEVMGCSRAVREQFAINFVCSPVYLQRVWLVNKENNLRNHFENEFVCPNKQTNRCLLCLRHRHRHHINAFLTY
jgi:hypothetical protein